MSWQHEVPRETLEKSMELAQKSLSMYDSASVHALLCVLYTIQRDHDKAIAEIERALALNPMADLLVEYAGALNAAGRPEEAIPLCRKRSASTPSGDPLYISISAVPPVYRAV